MPNIPASAMPALKPYLVHEVNSEVAAWCVVFERGDDRLCGLVQENVADVPAFVAHAREIALQMPEHAWYENEAAIAPIEV